MCDLHVSHRMRCGPLGHGPHLSLGMDPSQWLGAPAPLSLPCQPPFNRDAGWEPAGACGLRWEYVCVSALNTRPSVSLNCICPHQM